MSKNKIIAAIEAEQMTKEIPAFGPGDTIVVQVKVKEGNRERLQAFEGVVEQSLHLLDGPFHHACEIMSSDGGSLKF